MRIKKRTGGRQNSPLFMLLLVVAVLLSGCGSGNSANPDGVPDAEEAAPGSVAESSQPDGATKITFWFATGGSGNAAMQSILDEFNREHSAYYVVSRAFGSYEEIAEEVQTAIATGTAPDVALLERDISLDFSRKGLTVDLTRILQRDANFDPGHFYPVYFRQGVSEDGSIFAMPMYGETQVLYYNKAAFAAAGIRPERIKTWYDLAQAAAAIQRTGVCPYGWEPMWGYENMMDAAFSNGGTLFSEDGSRVTINSPEWVEVWEAFRVWLHDERIMRIHTGGWGWEYWSYTMRDAIEGRAGGYIGSTGDQADLDSSQIGMLEQPAWKPDAQAVPEAKALLLNVLASSTQAKQIGAYALIRYLIDAPAQVQWMMKTGYIAVNQDVLTDSAYIEYKKRNEYADIPLAQSAHASAYPYDPTGGAVREALKLAANRVQIENIPAQDALDEAQRAAQKALDRVAERPAEPVAEYAAEPVAEEREGGAP